MCKINIISRKKISISANEESVCMCAFVCVHVIQKDRALDKISSRDNGV